MHCEQTNKNIKRKGISFKVKVNLIKLKLNAYDRETNVRKHEMCMKCSRHIYYTSYIYTRARRQTNFAIYFVIFVLFLGKEAK